jgi:type IV pilus assembly protein PilO
MAKITVNQILDLTNTQKIASLSVIIGLLIAGYVFYIFMPQRDKINANSDTILKLQARFNEQQNILANLPRFQQELKMMQSSFEKSLKMLPNDREIASLLTNITTLAQESGLEINLFQPKPEVPMDFYAQIPVEMKVTGRYHQMGMFFDKLSQLPRIINIIDITLTQRKRFEKDKTDSVVFIDASFNATTFKFIEKTGGKPDARKKKK